MIVYENTLKQFFRHCRTKKLVNFICSEYESVSGKPATGEMRYSWKYTCLIVCTALSGAPVPPNDDTGIRIDIEESARTNHLKLTFASSGNGEYRFALLGLYAGNSVKLTNAVDIVTFREGSASWTSVHPSMIMSHDVRRLTRGIPENEVRCVSIEGASFLPDCFYSPDTDILTDYDSQITAGFPVFYANDAEDLNVFLEPVMRTGGADALRKLRSIESNALSQDSEERNEDQLYLVSSILTNVRRNRRAWYIIEGHTGTGQEEIALDIVDKLKEEGRSVSILKENEIPDDNQDLVIISQKDGGSLEQLEFGKVAIFLCDEVRDPSLDLLKSEANLAAAANKAGAQLYITHLKQNTAFVDGGKGMRWLANCLQLATIMREDYNPDSYDIRLIRSKDDWLPCANKGIACIVLPDNVTYDPETGNISYRKNQKKGVYNALAAGRNGAWIVCEDPALRKYLEKELFAVRQRQLQIRGIIKEMSSGQAGSGNYDVQVGSAGNNETLLGSAGNTEALVRGADNTEALVRGADNNGAKVDGSGSNASRTGISGRTRHNAQKNSRDELIRKADSKYLKKLTSCIGKKTFLKLSSQAVTWLVSALMAYDTMKDYDRMVDFSGVCVQIGKACEYELKKRIFTGYMAYEKKKYGEPQYLKKIPSACFSTNDTTEESQLLTEDQVTLGKLKYIMGLDDNGRIASQKIWHEFREYAEAELLVNPASSYNIIKSQMPVIARIRDEYRNPSAHAQEVTVVDAQECIQYVITVQKKLSELLEQYKY